jgi:hypothetical protein
MSRPSWLITAELAQQLQNGAIHQGKLLIWVVYERPIDFPNYFVARPQIPEAGRGIQRLSAYLRAGTLEELREQLPHGLVLLARHPADDPYIVECWL